MGDTASAQLRCVIYVRVSLDATGEQLAITRQLEDCRRIAAARGWVIVAVYADNSISAFKEKDRPEYEKMRAAYQRGEFEALIVWDLDRLTRQPKQLEEWVEAAEKRGLLIVTVTGDVDLSTDNGRLYARIKAAVARSEMERKSARQARAARQRAEQGSAPKGTRLTGYTAGGEIIEDEAAIVRGIFDRFYAGDSLRGIAAWLNETGVPTRRGREWHPPLAWPLWGPSAVRDILTNPRYAGRVYYNRHKLKTTGDWYPSQSLPIVEEHVFDTVNAKLADPRRLKQQGTDRKHLGAGLYLCPKGHPVRSHYLGGKPGYRCPHGCVNRTGAPIDDAVTRLVRARLGRSDISRLVNEPSGPEVGDVMREIRILRGKLDKVRDEYMNDLIEARDYKEKKERIQASLDQAEARQARLLAGSEVAGVLLAADAVKAFDDAPLGVRQSVIRFFMQVTLLPAPRGRRGFDLETIRIEPRHLVAGKEPEPQG